MKKKVLSLILATMLAMTVVACGGTEDVVETDSQTEDNVIEESVESESEVDLESETESVEETITEDVHDASADSIAHTEELAGEITCENCDFTVGVKMLDGYEVLFWRVDEFGSQQYALKNDTYRIDYRVYEGNIDEMYATDFEQVYDPNDTDHYLLDGVEVFETGELQNDDLKSIYYESENVTWEGEEYYTWLVYYWQVDENHYMKLSVETIGEDAKGYVLDINEFIDLTKECYFVIE